MEPTLNNQNPQAPVISTREKRNSLLMIVIGLFVVILILLAMYIWGGTLAKDGSVSTTTDAAYVPDYKKLPPADQNANPTSTIETNTEIDTTLY